MLQLANGTLGDLPLVKMASMLMSALMHDAHEPTCTINVPHVHDVYASLYNLFKMLIV